MHDRPVPRPGLPSIAAISVVGFALLVTLASRPAHAQSAEAEALFTEGDTLMKQGKIAEACDAFEGSNKLEPRAGTMIRLGECREKNGQLASAWVAYKDALTRVKDEKKKKIATAKVAELEPKLSYLMISVPDSSRIDGLEITRNGQVFDSVLWNRSLPVNGGDYAIVARAPNRAEWKMTAVVPKDSGKIKVDVPPLADAKAQPVKQPPTDKNRIKDAGTDQGGGYQPPEEPAAPARTSMWTGKRKLAAVLLLVGVGGGVGGAVFGSAAKSAEDEAFSLCPDPTFPCSNGDAANDALERGRTNALLANVSFGVGGACVIAAAVLWFTGAPARVGPSEAGDVAVRPLLSPSMSGLAIGGSF